jgi:sugar O-acyltransferase (sialic acid O-acetyltransferase NeuD family)
MARLIIAGAGGFGRELAAYARDAGFEVSGFLDDDEAAAESLHGVDAEAGLRGSIGAYAARDDELVAVGIGHPATRLRVGRALTNLGARLATVVHPTAWVAPSASLGSGVAVAPFACVGPGVTVSDLAMLNTYSSLGHDAVVGQGCVLASYSVATGYAVLEDEVFLASHAVVTPGRRVGAGARVSAGAVVFQDVPPGWLAAGNPARARAVPEARPAKAGE